MILRALVRGVFLCAAVLQPVAQSQSGPQALQGVREFTDHLETAIAKFHSSQNRYPESAQQLASIPELPPSVRSVRLGGTGFSGMPAVIELDLSSPDLGGHRLYLLLRADRSPSSWECVSTDIASIARLLPDCTYAPGYVPPRIKEPPLQPPWRALYEGTVGGSTVVALLWQVTQTTSTARDPAVPVEGLYYYRRHARNLTLLRARDGHGLVECPEGYFGYEACPRPTGIWDIEVGEERVTGTWRASSGAPPSVVKLARRPIGKGLAYDPHDSYYDLLHEDLRRSVAIEARRHGIVWKTERRGSGLRGLTGRIVLLESPDAASRERINQQLKKSISYPDSPADCARHPESCDDGNDLDVVFANERLFAVAGSSYWSGGAHPSNGFEAITFDLKSGEVIDWWHVVRVIDAAAGSAHPVDLGRGDLLASYVLRAAMEDPNDCLQVVAQYYGCDGDRCASGPDPKEGAWIIYPTIDGLAVSPQVYDEAQRGCREESIIVPWPDARKTLLRPMTLP